MTKYAALTDVSVDKSRSEIERTVVRYGADGFVSGWAQGKATVQFRIAQRHVRFTMDLPKQDEERFTLARVNQHGVKGRRKPEAARAAWEQACRSKWRSLFLVIKAKLEAVESEIATFEEAFFAEIVLPETGRTVFETARDQVRLSYEGKNVPLLPGIAP